MTPTELLHLQEKIIDKIQQFIPIHGDRVLKIGNEDFSWEYISHKHGFWTAPFWPAQLWLAYKMTAKEQFKNAARMSHKYFDEYLDDPHYCNHDLGFIYSLTSVADYKLTACLRSKQQAIRAAELLASRFKPVGGYLVAWQPFDHTPEAARFANDRVIVDTLQNLPLLLWAARTTGRQFFKDIAISHADMAKKYLIRNDYSSFHTYVFDAVSQQPLRGETHQGYAHDSCWSRGQAWLIHGYANLVLEYGLTQYIKTAEKLAEYAIKRLHEDTDYIPVWDFSEDEQCPTYLDSSAGAVMASGFLILAELIEDKSDYYRSWGLKLIKGLTKRCALFDNPNAHGLLAEGASHVTEGKAKNMLPYGDYYYLEAVLRARKIQRFFW